MPRVRTVLPTGFSMNAPGPPAFVAIGVEWCGYCTKLKPELARLANAVPFPVYYVAPDAAPRGVQVQGYPTIAFKTGMGKAYMYGGAHTAEAMARFARSINPV